MSGLSHISINLDDYRPKYAGDVGANMKVAKAIGDQLPNFPVSSAPVAVELHGGSEDLIATAVKSLVPTGTTAKFDLIFFNPETNGPVLEFEQRMKDEFEKAAAAAKDASGVHSTLASVATVTIPALGANKTSDDRQSAADRYGLRKPTGSHQRPAETTSPGGIILLK